VVGAGGFFTKQIQIFGPDLSVQAANPLFERTLKAGAAVVNLPMSEVAAAMRSDKLDAVVTTYETFMSLVAEHISLRPSRLVRRFPLVLEFGRVASWRASTKGSRHIGCHFDAWARLTRRMERRRRGDGDLAHEPGRLPGLAAAGSSDRLGAI
jgi:hypothetical protein